jgi:acyl dehydratase
MSCSDRDAKQVSVGGEGEGVLEILQDEIGVTRQSDWLPIDQPMISLFADATMDHQFIHVDPVKAASSPFGGTIAHGFLTLSLLTRLAEMTNRPAQPQAKIGVNYGFDRIRFVSPVPSGSRIRLALTVVEVEEKRKGQFQVTSNAVVEIEGRARPALTATWLSQIFT